MAKKEFSLEVISPMFLNGADTQQPEMRAASVRGQLRYWLRAIAGSETDDTKRVWERESAVFGSTGQGSAVTVRLFPQGTLNISKSDMLPHKLNERERSRQYAIQPGNRASLELITRPGVVMPDDALTVLKIWSLLGGLGKRSRRMFGAFSLIGEQMPKYDSPQELAEHIKRILTDAGCNSSTNRQIPKFPTLHPQHSWIIVCQKGFDDPESAVRSLFTDLLRSNEFRLKQETFGTANPRRSSPLIAQLRKIEDKYYPVLTALRCSTINPQIDRRIDWNHLKRFMETAASNTYYNGIHVWGGW
jgi:CRISPR-associated protein Cmr1